MGYYKYQEDEELGGVTIKDDQGLLCVASAYSTGLQEMVEYANMGRWKHHTTVVKAQNRYINDKVTTMNKVLRSEISDADKVRRLKEICYEELIKANCPCKEVTCE